MRNIEIMTTVAGPFISRPESTALVLIDFQRAFIDRQSDVAGRGHDVSAMEMAATVARGLLSVARSSSLTVVHTREGYAPDLSDVNALKKASGKIGRAGAIGRNLIRGEPNHEIISALQPLATEAVIDKSGFDAFYRTDIEEVLEGFSHLLICGLTTECCVASTIRGAVDRGFFCLTVLDACAGITPQAHQNTMDWLLMGTPQFGWACTAAEAIQGMS